MVISKPIEETYQKKTPTQHILDRPDSYIGSIGEQKTNLWIYKDNKMINKPVSYVPGLYKIFDEILVNAADNGRRDTKMNCVEVDIKVEMNLISVYNNGAGIPVAIHKDHGVYVPELVFGHLLTSSNYDDDQKKTTGGRNGYGAKLTNIFSTEFVIETADGKLEYRQVFKDNMKTKDEPRITKCTESDNWTKVSFKPDLARFNMTRLQDGDVVTLMEKRVVDIAACLGKSVKVVLNGQQVPINSFTDYINLYPNAAGENKVEPLQRIVEKVNDRWEIGVSLSDGQFEQVSFVNGIATIKGGTHVDYVTSQLTNHIISVLNKQNKSANLNANDVKSYLRVFVNALVDNPAFDSQAKETLTTQKSKFGSKCELSEAFLKNVVAKSGVVDPLLSLVNLKLKRDLKKTDGSKTVRVTGIPKLEDATAAGGKQSKLCTLILTEGDSAKSLAIAGLSVVGREYYGVFPLKGKLLNVREATLEQIAENAEIQSIKKILGLKQDKVYSNVKSLRYGQLMIMADQDHDGSHIKGLVINFIHSFWPSLLQVPKFMTEFITPIVKASQRRTQKVFYTIREYNDWKESLGDALGGWTIKYYKGLGTSDLKEAKQYFTQLDEHKKFFKWDGVEDGNAIELAFSKTKIEERKNWLRQFEPGTSLDPKEKEINYRDFVNKELIHFSMADVRRSIPSMIDGLKPGQRKILFCSFKRISTKEAKVAQFSGYVSEQSAYHHGEQSLASTIIGMAQNFVGSNNINVLQPKGQFGTRNQGGKDHASARYIFTQLAPITRYLFPKDDDILLDYLSEDGQKIEPTWYVPVVPMVLVNGAEGIGTGWSTYVPKYNPRDIVANIRRWLNKELMQPMDPWYKGFIGKIEKDATAEAGTSYTVSGLVEKVDDTKVKITELPIRKSTQKFKKFLESSMTGNEEIKKPFIKHYSNESDDCTVHFDVEMSDEEQMQLAMREGLLSKFKLTTTISTSNMHLFDSEGRIKKYDNPEKILEDFCHVRLDLYEKRKKILLENLQLDLLELDNKVNFIIGVIKGNIKVIDGKKADLLLELKEKGFRAFPKKTKVEELVAGATDAVETEEHSDGGSNAKGQVGEYDYLLQMEIWTLTSERLEKITKERDKLKEEVSEWSKATVMSLWQKDLDALEKELDEQDNRDVVDASRPSTSKNRMNPGGPILSRNAPKNPQKNTKAAKPPAAPAATKKRGSAAYSNQSQFVSQKQITDVLKPAKNARASPEKKMRKDEGN